MRRCQRGFMAFLRNSKINPYAINFNDVLGESEVASSYVIKICELFCKSRWQQKSATEEEANIVERTISD